MKTYSDCMEVREDFSAYLDSEMLAESRAAIEAHLAICAECLRELDALKRVDDSYRKLDHVAAPAGFAAGVHEAVRAGRMPSAANYRAAPRWVGPLVAMASAAAVLIVGVLVLKQRQPAPADLQLASAPAEAKESAATLSDTAAPARAEADSTSTSAAATWDNFTRAPARDDTTWKSFAKAPAAMEADSAGGGREDSGEALARGLAAADDKNKEAAASAERVADVQGVDDEARARAELIGTPQAAEAAPLAPPAPEKILDAPATQEEFKTDVGPAPAPRAPVGAGEVLSRKTLRSFRVGADGIWYERGYENQPRTALKRESPALRELMKRNSGEDWSKMIDREYGQVFQINGVWYELEAAPQETN